MKKVTVKNNAGEDVGNLGPTESPEAWIAGCVASNAWGLPERLVLHKDEPLIGTSEGYDEADVIGEEVREVSPAIEDVYEDASPTEMRLVSIGVPAVTRKYVKLRATYQIEIIDISAEYELAKCIAKRKSEYPTPEEFMNAFFDGGDAALEELRQRRLLVKAEYPKG